MCLVDLFSVLLSLPHPIQHQKFPSVTLPTERMSSEPGFERPLLANVCTTSGVRQRFLNQHVLSRDEYTSHLLPQPTKKPQSPRGKHRACVLCDNGVLTFKNGPGPWWDSRQGRILLLHSWLNDTFKDSKGPTLATAERCPLRGRRCSLKNI